MKKSTLSKATLGRLPMYLRYIRSQSTEYISASEMARTLNLGEVLVRKDLGSVCDLGRPKVGYPRRELLQTLEDTLGVRECVPVVLAGTGKLGRALMRYRGFEDFGLRIVAGFDVDPDKLNLSDASDLVLPMEQLDTFCRQHGVRVGVITVPAFAAQAVCDRMVEAGITAIWNFAPCRLSVPEGISLRHEDLALSLAHLYLGRRPGAR